jgi:hypothetical protein
MRFGVEIELDATDGRDFAARPLVYGEMPAGYDRVVRIVSDLDMEIQHHGWKHNHNNSVWICKPDSSCGMELCSPVMDESEMDDLVRVMDALAADPALTSGPNCSLHVHVDVSDLVEGIPESSDSLCSVLAWWVKCEPFMLESVPEARRNSRFCRCIGMTDLFDHEERVVPCLAVSKLREKYLSLNAHHLVARKRNSIEFRVLEGTKDSSLVSSWVGFVLNFVRRASAAGAPENYRWASPEEFIGLVGHGPHMDWIGGRIGDNSPSNSLRFWRVRAEAEGFVFGRRPAFIGGQQDK